MAGSTDSASPACEVLLSCLASEESALDELLFKLKEQHLMLSSGENRWLARTSGEVNAALEALTAAGQRREEAARAVHADLRLSADATLSTLAERVADEEICQLLHQRRRSLRSTLDLVRRSSRQNRELLSQNLAATQDALSVLGNTPTYDSAGTVGRSAPRLSRIIDTRA